MLRHLRTLFAAPRTGGAAATGPPRLALAMAALLVEAARADHRIEAPELEATVLALARRLKLAPADAASLLAEARVAVERSVSLHEFTRPLHADLSPTEKLEFVAALWEVALADRQLDRYEEYLIGKVAELLYVARGDVIRLRNAVQDEIAAYERNA
jgi:uncharacterized tellurite resistance protein B-like protein